MARSALVALFLLSAGLTGCLGGDDGGDEEVRRQRATVTSGLGGIEGVVTDEAIQPLAGANVTLVELEVVTATDTDGSYQFSNVQPGTYTVAVSGPGLLSTQQAVAVSAGRVATLDFVVAHLFTQEAYTQAFELVGFAECGVGWHVTLADVQGVTFNSLAACAVPNLVTGENATNDRFLHNFYLDPPVETVVYEMTWDAGGSPLGGPELWSVLEIRDFVNVNGSRFFNLIGPNPLYKRLDKDPHFLEMEQNFTTRCEEGEDEWCGLDFWDKGWNMLLRVFAASDCLPTPATACLVFQQEFTHLISAFYNAPAPPGYRLVQA
jgi:hypothetical protein